MSTVPDDIDRDFVINRLLEVFTLHQLELVAEAMEEVTHKRYGKVEIEIHGDRVFIWGGKSHDGGDVVRRCG